MEGDLGVGADYKCLLHLADPLHAFPTASHSLQIVCDRADVYIRLRCYCCMEQESAGQEIVHFGASMNYIQNNASIVCEV